MACLGDNEPVDPVPECGEDWHERRLPVWLTGKPCPKHVTVWRQVVDGLHIAEPLSLCEDGRPKGAQRQRDMCACVLKEGQQRRTIPGKAVVHVRALPVPSELCCLIQARQLLGERRGVCRVPTLTQGVCAGWRC